MTTPILEVVGLAKSYGRNTVVDNVNIAMAPSSIEAVIGPNGAGKSTLFGLVAGQVRPDAGRILLDGRDITSERPHRRARMGIARAFQVAHLFGTRTVAENIAIASITAAGSNGVFWRSAERQASPGEIAEVLEQVGLADRADQLAAQLAQGDRKKLEIAMCIASSPRLLLLDEPAAGLRGQESEAITDLVRQIHQTRGCSVLIIEHDMKLIFGLAQRVTVLAQGAVLCQGRPDEVRADPRVKSVYLGES